MQKLIRKIHWFLSDQCGLDLIRFVKSVINYPHYIFDLYRFNKAYFGPLRFLPCLHDRYEEGGTTKSEYFWQDLLVARMIFDAKPQKHVDIGSRVDGFIAHVASYREIEVLDVRPVATQIPSVTFTQADLMEPLEEMKEYCDSLSCLHALEHFGLGRYGDPINPIGYELGFFNMSNILKENGMFYLSVPIGIERVEFNAHRVFDPRTINKLAITNSLCLIELTAIWQDGSIKTYKSNEISLDELASQNYVLGLFIFAKRTQV